jgi:hypothetical protein
MGASMNYKDQMILIKESAEELGALRERNRILSLLVYYREAGWLDDAFAHLMVEDICGVAE